MLSIKISIKQAMLLSGIKLTKANLSESNDDVLQEMIENTVVENTPVSVVMLDPTCLSLYNKYFGNISIV